MAYSYGPVPGLLSQTCVTEKIIWRGFTPPAFFRRLGQKKNPKRPAHAGGRIGLMLGSRNETALKSHDTGLLRKLDQHPLQDRTSDLSAVRAEPFCLLPRNQEDDLWLGGGQNYSSVASSSSPPSSSSTAAAAGAALRSTRGISTEATGIPGERTISMPSPGLISRTRIE